MAVRKTVAPFIRAEHSPLQSEGHFAQLHRGRSAIVIASETHGEVTDVCAREPYRPCSRLARLGGFRLPGRSLRTLSCHRRAGGRFSPREAGRGPSEKPVQRPHPRWLPPLSRVALSVPATLLTRGRLKDAGKQGVLRDVPPALLRTRPQGDLGVTHPSVPRPKGRSAPGVGRGRLLFMRLDRRRLDQR
jgi:hypothetical protein